MVWNDRDFVDLFLLMKNYMLELSGFIADHITVSYGFRRLVWHWDQMFRGITLTSMGEQQLVTLLNHNTVYAQNLAF